MFSVDNFYDFFDSHYGWDQNQTMLWRFAPHGSKDFLNLFPFFDDGTFLKQKQIYDTHGAIILHDQEPFDPYLIDTYRENLFQQKKESMWKEMTRRELLLLQTHTCSWPIFCHSEHNSKDIKYVSSQGLIECYYFWHGLIARDWFRHWRHHKDLTRQHQWKKRFLLYARDFTGSRTYRYQMIESLRSMSDEIEYNWQGEPALDSNYSAKIVVNDAVNTAVHIVAETVFDQNKVHVTEKIFKPMIMRQPFIVYSGAGTLEYLRRYGFRTFNDIWDEGYDKISDPTQRFNRLNELITSLYRLPKKEFQLLLDRCQDILDHNRQHFFSNDFENIMLTELHQNINNGLDQQKRLLIDDPGGGLYAMIDSIKNRDVEFAKIIPIWIRTTSQHLRDHHPNRYQSLIKKYPWALDYL